MQARVPVRHHHGEARATWQPGPALHAPAVPRIGCRRLMASLVREHASRRGGGRNGKGRLPGIETVQRGDYAGDARRGLSAGEHAAGHAHARCPADPRGVRLRQRQWQPGEAGNRPGRPERQQRLLRPHAGPHTNGGYRASARAWRRRAATPRSPTSHGFLLDSSFVTRSGVHQRKYEGLQLVDEADRKAAFPLAPDGGFEPEPPPA